MSYYLGKVGRAGARLVSTAKDLYNDVNAAYLTGAVDVIVVRQADGVLRSTPFHVRFGKLGVLRTGDLKEVEIEINGETVDLPMRIDESGRGFFLRSKASDSESSSHSLSDKTEDHVSIDIESSISAPILSSSHNASHDSHVTRSDSMDTPPPLSKMLSESTLYSSCLSREEFFETQRRASEPVELRVVSSDLEELPLSASAPERSSPISIQKLTTGVEDVPSHHHRPPPLPLLPPPPSSTIHPSHLPVEDSDTSTRSSSKTTPEKQQSEIDISDLSKVDLPDHISEDVDGFGVRGEGVRVVRGGEEEAVLSDSAIERSVRWGRREDGEGGEGAKALSDTEVKDRLPSKLWEWSATRRSSKSESAATAHVMTASSNEELKRRELPKAPVDRTGFWGTLAGILRRRKRRRLTSTEDGIYLDDIDSDSMDPQELSKFFPNPSVGGEGAMADNTGSSGLGSSPLLSPTEPSTSSSNPAGQDIHKLVETLDDVALSLCGGLDKASLSDEAFKASEVSFADFCSNPSLLSSPQLVVRVAGKYYNWQVGIPLIMSAVVYCKPLPEASQSKLVKKYMPKKGRQPFWYFWGRGSNDVEGDVEQEKAKSEGNTPLGSPRKWMGGAPSQVGVVDIMSSDDDQEVLASKMPSRPRQRSLKRKKSGFTNQLTSDQLASLNLKSGANEIVFSITTKYQGTTKAMCTLYLWDHRDKLVVSDIDGTITRSDVAGQVLPLLGKDWTQNGVVELFSSVAGNGYRILYLSARAIGQAWYTKEFLRGVRRGKASLPDGPLLLAPFSLYTAFKKEVIEKRPEEFKIDCLKEIKALFPGDTDPLHAGFGNKFTDVKAYQKVSIPSSRIFTVNHKGHMKCEMSWTFQSSYTDLMGFVDAQFPPLEDAESASWEAGCASPSEHFSSFHFWRDTPTVNLDLLPS